MNFVTICIISIVLSYLAWFISGFNFQVLHTLAIRKRGSLNVRAIRFGKLMENSIEFVCSYVFLTIIVYTNNVLRGDDSGVNHNLCEIIKICLVD